ncbi:unnamed protein product [marine sediment metagenome]|uniref:Uncharacterized protein n=1 Tax=marine sediment metagenome TaxID=412755 RepID=X0Y1Q3_9ZZZZ
MIRKYPKTNLFIIDDELWKWAKYKASLKGFNSVSEYLFDLVKFEKDGQVYEGEVYEERWEDSLHLVIGEPQTQERAGLFIRFDSILRPLIGKRIKFTIRQNDE